MLVKRNFLPKRTDLVVTESVFCCEILELPISKPTHSFVVTTKPNISFTIL